MNQDFLESLTTTLNGLIQSLQILSQELSKQVLIVNSLEEQKRGLIQDSVAHQKKVIELEKQKQQFLSEKDYLNKKTAELKTIEISSNKAKLESEERIKVAVQAEEKLKTTQLETDKKIGELDDLRSREQDLLKREELMKKEIAIDRDRKELLQAKEQSLEQKATRLQRLTQV